MSSSARTLGLTLLLVTAAFAQPVRAQSAAERGEARKHADAGRQHFEAGELEDAIARFEQAEAIIHAPPHLLYVARAHRRAGRWLMAAEVYQKLVGEKLGANAPPPFHEALAAGAAELDDLGAKIPKLAIAVRGPASGTAQVTVDGKPASVAPFAVDPGEHRVVASADGFVDQSEQVTVAEGAGVVAVTLSLEAAAAGPVAPPPAEAEGGDFPIPPVVLLGAGAAFVVVGAVTGGLALGTASELRDACPSNPCPTENQSLADDANLLATLSTIGLVVGGLAMAGGATWLVLELTGGDGDGGETALRLGPGFLAIDGHF